MSFKLDPARVPSALSSLLPLAEKWGIGDDGYRVQALENATDEELRELVGCLDTIDDGELWKWLEGPEADDPNPTEEYLALTCLTMAIETAESVLKERGVSSSE
jgi:hypothetical protein